VLTAIVEFVEVCSVQVCGIGGINYSAGGHAVAGVEHHADGLVIMEPAGVAQQELRLAGLRKLGCAAEATVLCIKAVLEEGARVAQDRGCQLQSGREVVAGAQLLQARMDALSHQINPHFLYNTLDSIIWMVELGENDRVAIVTYADGTAVPLPSARGNEQKRILAAIDALQAGGCTYGSAGIELAYRQAAEHFVSGGVNRVILCTDGDLNVGVTDDVAVDTLTTSAERFRAAVSKETRVRVEAS